MSRWSTAINAGRIAGSSSSSSNNNNRTSDCTSPKPPAAASPRAIASLRLAAENVTTAASATGPMPVRRPLAGAPDKAVTSVSGGVSRATSRSGSTSLKPDNSAGADLLKRSLRSRFAMSSQAALTRLSPWSWKQEKVQKKKKKKTFYGASRGIRLLIKVCIACRELLWYQVSSSSWYRAVEDVLDEVSSVQRQAPTGQSVFVVNAAGSATSGEPCRLEFDAAAYKRCSPRAREWNPAAFAALMKRPDARTPDDVEQIMQHCRQACAAFQSYAIEHQRLISKSCFYERYGHQRVILREGLHPGGFYFVLNGTLIESGSKMTEPRLLRAGDKFGEDDLKNGRRRQTTVISTNSAVVELLYVYKEDYHRIFHRTVSLNKEQVKQLCRKDSFLAAYPMHKIIDNTTVCVLLKYKYNKLICADSNATEHVYVVISGKARAIQRLSNEDVLRAKARPSPAKQSHAQQQHRQRHVSASSVQALAVHSCNKHPSDRQPNWLLENERAHDGSDASVTASSRSADAGLCAPAEVLRGAVQCETRSKWTAVGSRQLSAAGAAGASCERPAVGPAVLAHSALLTSRRPREDSRRCRSAVPIAAPGAGEVEGPSSKWRRLALAALGGAARLLCARSHTTRDALKRHVAKSGLPCGRKENACVFLQVRELLPGHVFGLRACLPAEERGAAAALVSAGCEVMQIQRDFFEKHLDENVLGLLRVKAAPFMDVDELVAQFELKQKWKEYRESLVALVTAP